jgi:hypothetical protein
VFFPASKLACLSLGYFQCFEGPLNPGIFGLAAQFVRRAHVFWPTFQGSFDQLMKSLRLCIKDPYAIKNIPLNALPPARVC